jgi:hypothetical protein
MVSSIMYVFEVVYSALFSAVLCNALWLAEIVFLHGIHEIITQIL